MREEIEEYINDNYDNINEYPWEKFPNFETFKHKKNNKWFALIMNVPYRKLNIDKDGMVDVLNLKNNPDMIGSLRKIDGILPAYHMNKEYWITVLLDGIIEKEKIYELIDISYDLTM